MVWNLLHKNGFDPKKVVLRRKMHIQKKLYEAFKAGDVKKIQQIFEQSPKLKSKRMTAGGNWIYSMGPDTTLEVVEHLINWGLDPHEKAKQEGDNSLCSAARSGRDDLVLFLLDLNVKIDTSLSVRNPLFAAVVAASGLLGSGIDRSGNPERVIELLFDHGIDASIEYKSPTMNRLNAAGFAICRNVPDIADLIVKLQSQANSEPDTKFMKKAKKAAWRQKFPSPYRKWIEVV